MDEDMILDNSLMHLSIKEELMYEPSSLALQEFMIYWEHVTVKKFFSTIQLKWGDQEFIDGNAWLWGAVLLSTEKKIFGNKMVAGLRKQYFKTNHQTFIQVEGDYDTVPLHKQSHCNIVFVEVHHFWIWLHNLIATIDVKYL